MVGVPVEGDDTKIHLQLVTASHVVPHDKPTFMRLRRLLSDPPAGEPLNERLFEEEVVDVELGTWHRHPIADLATTLIVEADPRWAIGVVPWASFVGRSPHEPELGEDVVFAGLLAQVDSMAERHVPMLRGGMIGALYQHKIPMVEPGGTRRLLDGHLIDCRSFGGFSGAPCFVSMIRTSAPGSSLHVLNPTPFWQLLGVVGGHFDHRSSIEIQGDSLSVPTSAGVAVVYPSELLTELLEDEALIAERALDT